jgi:glucose-6-phosphate isomerase
MKAGWGQVKADTPLVEGKRMELRDGGQTLTALFAADVDRVARLSRGACGIRFDFSKMRLAAGDLDALAALATDQGLPEATTRLFAGEVVNPSEGRAATHAAERASGGSIEMRAVVDRIRAGCYRHVLHIGIGGSALGPAVLLDAIPGGDGPAAHVVANIDGVALERAVSACDPTRTLVVVVSKTFTTTETMTNASSALDWMRAAGVAKPMAHVVAVTAAPDKAAAWGVARDNILGFAESVGGRYSLWSAVGLPFALRHGWDAFAALLGGAAAMDAAFAADPVGSAPGLAAMIDYWNARVLRLPTRGVFAYDERLRLLPAYLQQLEMESNGKSVTAAGAPVAGPTAPVTWGGTGTDAQHAVFQLLHQGTQAVPVEFVAVREPGHGLGGTHHRQLLANCFAQGAALMRGRTFEEALALSGGDPALAAAKTFPGNRPSATILLDRLDPATLGSLLAFYEHRTFAGAVLMGINQFDEWGVELGKEMAKALENGGDFDASTADLMRRAGL